VPEPVLAEDPGATCEQEDSFPSRSYVAWIWELGEESCCLRRRTIGDMTRGRPTRASPRKTSTSVESSAGIARTPGPNDRRQL
jgi:hypothetical protein